MSVLRRQSSYGIRASSDSGKTEIRDERFAGAVHEDIPLAGCEYRCGIQLESGDKLLSDPRV